MLQLIDTGGSTLKSLQTLMQEQLPEGGVAIPGGRDPHIEVIEVAITDRYAHNRAGSDPFNSCHCGPQARSFEVHVRCA